MNWNLEEENKIRRYLLGDLPEEAKQQVEENLLRDDEYADWLLVVEDELIDNYVQGALLEHERILFEQNFSMTPRRHEKLMLVWEIAAFGEPTEVGNANYTNEKKESAVLSARVKEIEVESGEPPLIEPLRQLRSDREWWRSLFLSGWKIAAYAVIVIGLGVGFWNLRSSNPDIAAVTNTVNEVYRVRRPLEARITGFDYAPFPKMAGNEQEEVDYVVLDRAERVLLDAFAANPTTEIRHTLGCLFLARKKFDQAETLLREAVRDEPSQARLHSDLGAVLFEKWERARSTGQAPETDQLKLQSQSHLERALQLDESLREARFNLALLYQSSNQPLLARREWEILLASESDSRARSEIELNLKLLK